jgi:hypothetical protein
MGGVMLKYLFGFAICLYLISNIISHPLLDLVISFTALLAVLCSILFVKKLVLLFGIIFLTLGYTLLVTSESSFGSYVMSFGEMLNLLTLFSVIPILALPIKLGNYAKEVQAVIQKKINNSGQLYMVSSGISFFLSSFMNLAALPMTYYAIRSSADIFAIKNKERFISRSITHGFAMPLLWTPVTPIVGIVIEMTGVGFTRVLPLLIVFSVIGLILDWITANLLSKRNSPTKKGRETTTNGSVGQAEREISATYEVQNESSNSKRLIHILIAVLLLNCVIVLFDLVFSLSFLFLVSILVIPFSFIWSLLLKKGKSYFTGLKEHFRTHLPKMKDQFFLFLSAGFFISTISISGADKTVNTYLGGVIDLIGVNIFLVLLPFIPVMLAFIGIHPAVVFALIAEAINPSLLDLSPIVLTIAMLGGAVPAFLMGPYNATVGVMSNIINTSPFKISNWNFQFTYLYMIILIVFLQIIQYVIES